MDEYNQILAPTIEALYRTLSDDSAWGDVLTGLARSFDSPRVSILRASATVDEPFDTHSLNFDEEMRRSYDGYYWSKDPTVPISREAHVGVWTNCDALLDPKKTPCPEYVHDYASRHGLRYVCGAKLYSGQNSIVIFGLYRPKDHGPFGYEGEATFNQLFPHLARVAALSEELRRARFAHALSQAAIDAVEWPVYVVNARACVLLANRAALECLRSNTPFVDRGGRLTSADLETREKLAVGIRSAVGTRAAAFGVRVDRKTWLVRIVPATALGACAIVYLAPPGSPAPASEVLRQLLNFSEAESAIASLIAEGYTVKEIAFDRKVSVNTVRAQVRAVMDKAGVRRQTDLVKILLSVPCVSERRGESADP